MRKIQIFIILLLIALLGGLSYYFGYWAIENEGPDPSVPSDTETETNPVKDEADTQAKSEVLDGDADLDEELEQNEAWAAKPSATESTARPVQNGQSRIEDLVEGTTLLGESTRMHAHGKKTIRVYDVGNRFKYSKVRVETLQTETGAESMTAMVADHLIVRVKDSGVSAEEVRDELSALGLKVRRKMNTAGHYLVTLENPQTAEDTSSLEFVHKRLGDTVEIAEPDFIVFTTAIMPNDSDFDQLWGMHNTGQDYGLVDADIDAPEAWELSVGSREIVVAVIDTGVDYNHPDLAANIWHNAEEIAGDGIDNDGNGFVDDVRGWDFCDNDNDPMDEHDHGTHCAGTIGAVGNNGAGVVGVNMNVSILPLRFLDHNGFGITSDGIDCVNYSTLIGVNLSSNSWGGGGFSQTLKDAIAAAGQANQLFVAAAGNDSNDVEVVEYYPSGYTFDESVDNVISVASTSRYNYLSYFSNYAASKVDLGAPGSDILSTIIGDTYGYMSGTSMATPHVAGACALYLSVNADVEFQKVKQDLLDAAVPIEALNGKCLTGGILNLHDFVTLADASPVRVHTLTVSGSVGLPDHFSPGETVTIRPVYRNSSSAQVDSVISDLSTSTAGVNVGVSRIDLGSMQGGEAIQPEPGFSLTIPEGFETPGFIDLEIKTVVGAINPSMRRLQLKVFEEAEVKGAVTDANSGEAIAGATVLASGSLDVETQSDSNGNYSLWTIVGDYSMEVRKPGYANQNRDIITPVSGPIDFALTRPQLEIDQLELNVELMEGESREIEIVLSNGGNGNLEWSLERGGALLPNGKAIYTHDTSEPYIWSDISDLGTTIELADDTTMGPYELGFDFFFYGQTFDSINVCSNGFLDFTSRSVSYYNSPLNSSNTPPNIIAFYWDDMYFGGNASSAYYYRNEAGQMVFQFDNAEFYREPNARFSAQVILSEDGTTQILYKEIGHLGSATVGLRGSETSDFYQVSYNDNFGSNYSTLTMKPTFLAEVLGDKSGTLGGNVHKLRLRVNPGSLPPGTYQDDLVINSNEMGGSVHRVPVTLKISADSHLVIGAQDYQEHAGLGDTDSIPEINETLNLNLILENRGTLASEQQTAKIIGSDTHIEVLQADSIYPAIPSGGQGTNQTPFVVRIKPSAPLGHEAEFQLKYFDTNGADAGSSAFKIKVQYAEQVEGSVKIYEIGEPLPGSLVVCGETSVAADAQGQYSLSFDAPGTYTIRAEAKDFISEEKVINLPYADALEFELMNPTLEVNPSTYSAVIYKGDSHEGSIQLSNTGYGPLEWEVVSSDKLKYIDPEYVLSMDTPYVWNDISAIGERVLLTDDNSRGPYDLGFCFNFYDESFDQVRICSNGFLNFGKIMTNYRNEPLTTSFVPDYFIAFLWDDLFFNPDSLAFVHRVEGEQCTFQFSNVSYYEHPEALLSLQVVIKSDGSITMYYKKVDVPDSATIGIRGNFTENSDAVKEVAFNTAVVQDESALTLSPVCHEYGSFTSPLSGTLNHETDTMQFKIDSSPLPAGRYHYYLVLKTNQVDQNLQTLPIDLRIYQNSLYEQFLEKHKVPRPKWGIGIDDDHDGWSNFMEFAFGLDPTSCDGNFGLNLFSISSNPGDGGLAGQITPDNQNVLNFEYRRRTDAAGLEYQFQSCDGLGEDWLTIDSPNEVTSGTSDADIERVQVTVPVDSTKLNKFYRIKVLPK